MAQKPTKAEIDEERQRQERLRELKRRGWVLGRPR